MTARKGRVIADAGTIFMPTPPPGGPENRMPLTDMLRMLRTRP
jgi:hypothetical protein